jgi:hypothetical protein
MLIGLLIRMLSSCGSRAVALFGALTEAEIRALRDLPGLVAVVASNENGAQR